MDLKNEIELANTRRKLKTLQERYEAGQNAPDADNYVNRMSRRSLKRLINQLTEEVVRFESRAKAKSSS